MQEEFVMLFTNGKGSWGNLVTRERNCIPNQSID
jgi:hypothetical protein